MFRGIWNCPKFTGSVQGRRRLLPWRLSVLDRTSRCRREAGSNRSFGFDIADGKHRWRGPGRVKSIGRLRDQSLHNSLDEIGVPRIWTGTKERFRNSSRVKYSTTQLLLSPSRVCSPNRDRVHTNSSTTTLTPSLLAPYPQTLTGRLYHDFLLVDSSLNKLLFVSEGIVSWLIKKMRPKMRMKLMAIKS